MSNYHEVLRKHHQLQVEDLKKRDEALDAAVTTERRDGETAAETVTRMFREGHPQLLKYYQVEVR